MDLDSWVAARRERSNLPVPAVGVAATEFPVRMECRLLVRESLDPNLDPKAATDLRLAAYRRLNKRQATFQYIASCTVDNTSSLVRPIRGD